MLVSAEIPDPLDGSAKWRRLFAGFAERQNASQDGIHVVGFIRRAMAPERWVGKRPQHESIRTALNEVLIFSGLQLTEEGRIVKSSRARTLTEAQDRANRLQRLLEDRGVHEKVLTFCRAELVDSNYFHAAFETTKSVADRLRELSGLDSDAGKLAQDALSLGKHGRPIVAVNSLTSESDRSEQSGFCNLVVGFFGMFRNTTAHVPKIHWDLSEEDALDIMTIASFLHRKLDLSARMDTRQDLR